MLTLYVKTGCPFCNKTLPIFNALEGVETEVKNIAEPGVAEELIEKGGKGQVPFLHDAKTGVQMYESDDIIEYLKKEYGGHELGEGKEKEEEKPSEGGVCPV